MLGVYSVIFFSFITPFLIKPILSNIGIDYNASMFSFNIYLMFLYTIITILTIKLLLYLNKNNLVLSR